MPLDWIDVTDLSFNTVLLLEREQIAWLPGWLPEPELAIALRANPAVAWYLKHKNPAVAGWVDGILAGEDAGATPEEIRAAERHVLASMNDLVCYAVDPSIYDRLAHNGWDSRELTDLGDFDGKLVADVGAGTGRQTFIAAGAGAHAVFAVEPVENLRIFINEKARAEGRPNVHPVSGLITDLPFPDAFLDVVMGGHVFGDHPEEELAELTRVVKPDGTIILCPGNNDVDDERHEFLTAHGFAWSRFEEPGDGLKRKYWRRR